VCWANVYADVAYFYPSLEDATLPPDARRIACVKLTGEYEVEI